MSKSARAGAAALVAGPVIGLVAMIVLPTLSDDAADIVAALSAHHSAMIAGLTLQTLSIPIMVAGIVWLATTLTASSPRLAITGGILGAAGGLVILFEDGLTDAAPSIVSSLDAGHASAALHQLHSSVATSIDPFALLLDVGVACLAFAAVRAGAPRWVAVALTVTAVAQGVGFAAASRPVVTVAFAAMAVLFALVVRSMSAHEEWQPAHSAVAVA
jgi:hypothetical protein